MTKGRTDMPGIGVAEKVLTELHNLKERNAALTAKVAELERRIEQGEETCIKCDMGTLKAEKERLEKRLEKHKLSVRFHANDFPDGEES